jgi:hypothetical protein
MGSAASAGTRTSETRDMVKDEDDTVRSSEIRIRGKYGDGKVENLVGRCRDYDSGTRG